MASGVSSRFGALVLATSLVAAACGDDSTDDLSDPDSAADPQEAAEPVEVATWSGDDLLPAAGGMARVDEVGVYYAVDGDRYMLAAIDVTSGEELWRHQVHPHNRVPGVVQTPTIDTAAGLVFATTGDWDRDFEGYSGLAAFDLRTGDVKWEVPAEIATNTPELCADLVCLQTQSSGYAAYNKTDGSQAAVDHSGALYTVVGGRGDYRVTTDPEERLVELGQVTDNGYEQIWRRSYEDLFGEAGVQYSSLGGWTVDVDEESGAAVVAFGATPNGDPDSWSEDELAAYLDLGWAVALVSPDGASDRVLTQVLPCSGLTWEEGGVEICEQIAVPEDYSLAARATFARISRYGFDGTKQWSADLRTPVREESLGHTSDPDLLAVQDQDDGPMIIDREDGAILGADDDEAEGLLLRCRSEAEPPFVRIRRADNAADRYIRVYSEDLAGLCDLDGEEVEVTDLPSQGETAPRWFGPSSLVDDEPTEPVENREGANRWAIWYGHDGTVHGAGPAE